MARNKKLISAEAKFKKKEYDRKRRKKMKEDPKSLQKPREKERLKYIKKGTSKKYFYHVFKRKEDKEKNNKKYSQTYRDKKAQVRKNLARILDRRY